MFDSNEIVKGGEFVELRFGMEWDYVPISRQYIHNFLSVSCGDMAVAEKFSMAVSELLENAVKYSENHQPYMLVHVDEKSKQVSGMVENMSNPNSIKSLQELFDTIMEGTPMEAYVNQMKQAAVRDDGKSQLGLARIRYEANLDMKMEIDENKVRIYLRTK